VSKRTGKGGGGNKVNIDMCEYVIYELAQTGRTTPQTREIRRQSPTLKKKSVRVKRVHERNGRVMSGYFVDMRETRKRGIESMSVFVCCMKELVVKKDGKWLIPASS
jgi:hypothetical protein